MSKPRWIDGGVFRTLRTATRSRKLAVIVGPEHGDAQVSSRHALREALAGNDRAALADDGRFRSKADDGLAALYTLRQPGMATTAVSDALLASAPEGEKIRVFGPDSKGLKGAWDRKDVFVTYLRGRAAEPETLVLTNKDRKPLQAADGRYQAFLRATFSRTVLFTGFRLDDPDLQELLEDVTRCFNGHVPQNIALVPAESTDPAAALRANMHYGMSLVEFPADQTPSQALAEIAHILEDLEIPKPATGNPPRGFTELTDEVRSAVGAASAEQTRRFADGDSSGWESIQAGADVRRTLTGELAGLLGGDVEGERPLVALVRGPAGEGKTVLARRLAWDLAAGPARIFWRESGADLPDRYVPEESESARAVFVLDDSHELALLPQILRSVATAATAPKVRFLLTTEGNAWDRSGLDHRIRQHADVRDFTLEGLAADEVTAFAESLVAAGRCPNGDQAARDAMQGTDGVLMERIAAASGTGSIAQSVAALLSELASHGDADRLRRAYLATALVHRHGTSLSRAHLAAFLGLDEASVAAQVLEPLGRALVCVGDSAIRTPHPLIAAAAVEALAPDESARDQLIIELLGSLPGGSIADPTVLHAPSELIRMRRQQPLAPLTLGKLFAAGEEAARNDVHFWFDRGRYEADFSRWEEALSAFDQASWRRPGDPAEKEHNAVVQANRARCLQSLGRKREALGAVDEGLRLSPNDASLVRLREKLGGRRPDRGRGGRGRGGRGGPGGGPGGRGGPGGGRGGSGGGRGGPGGGRGGSGGGRGGPGGGRGGPGAGRQGPRRPGDAPRRGPAQPGQA